MTKRLATAQLKLRPFFTIDFFSNPYSRYHPLALAAFAVAWKPTIFIARCASRPRMNVSQMNAVR